MTDVQDSNIPVFTFYLDEEMVTSFISTMDGGIAVVEKVSRTLGDSSSRTVQGEAGGEARLPAIFSVSGSTNLNQQSARSDSEVLEFERQRTMTSLFNELRHRLLQSGQILLPEEMGYHSLRPGDLIEVKGDFEENPFDALSGLFNMYTTLKPLFDPGNPNSLAAPHDRKRSGSPRNPKPNLQATLTREENAVKDMLAMVDVGFNEAGITDVTLHTQHPEFQTLIMTLRNKYDLGAVRSMAQGAECRVVGKVTGIISDTEQINLYRHSYLKFFPVELVESVFAHMQNVDGLDFSIGDLTIQGPSLQILPLAIFI